MKTPRPNLTSTDPLTNDRALLEHAAMRFELYHTPEGEIPESWHTHASAEEWRKDRKFVTDPRDVYSAFATVWDDFRLALEEGQIAIQHGLPAAKKHGALFRYTHEERRALKVILQGAIYPQTMTLGTERFKEMYQHPSMADQVEVRRNIRDKIQEIALLRTYMSDLCDELNEVAQTEFKASTMSFKRTRDELNRLKQRGDSTVDDRVIRDCATEILAVYDLIQRETPPLVDAINASIGKNILAKENVVSLDSRRR